MTTSSIHHTRPHFRINRFKKIDQAHDAVVGLMKALLEKHKQQMADFDEEESPRFDVATMMIRANKQDGKSYMSEEELVLSVFIFLFESR